jgi:hypothetical protein
MCESRSDSSAPALRLGAGTLAHFSAAQGVCLLKLLCLGAMCWERMLRVPTLAANLTQVLGEMLDLLRNHQHNKHSARLEVIVIVLILVEV